MWFAINEKVYDNTTKARITIKQIKKHGYKRQS